LAKEAKHDAGEVSRGRLQRAGGRCEPVEECADSTPKVTGENLVGCAPL